MIDFAEIKRAIAGREVDFLSQYLTTRQLSGRDQACPSCGGKDKYRHLKNHDGAFRCSTFDKTVGDVFDHVAHTQNMTMAEVFREALIFTGLDKATDIDRAKAKKRRAVHLEKVAKIQRVKMDRVYLGAAMDRLYSQLSHTKGEVDEDELSAARDLLKAINGVYAKPVQREDAA